MSGNRTRAERLPEDVMSAVGALGAAAARHGLSASICVSRVALYASGLPAGVSFLPITAPSVESYSGHDLRLMLALHTAAAAALASELAAELGAGSAEERIRELTETLIAASERHLMKMVAEAGKRCIGNKERGGQ